MILGKEPLVFLDIQFPFRTGPHVSVKKRRHACLSPLYDVWFLSLRCLSIRWVAERGGPLFCVVAGRGRGLAAGLWLALAVIGFLGFDDR